MTTARVLGRDFPIAPTVEYQLQYHKVGVKIRGRSAAVQLRIETGAPSKPGQGDRAAAEGEG